MKKKVRRSQREGEDRKIFCPIGKKNTSGIERSEGTLDGRCVFWRARKIDKNVQINAGRFSQGQPVAILLSYISPSLVFSPPHPQPHPPSYPIPSPLLEPPVPRHPSSLFLHIWLSLSSHLELIAFSIL